MSLPRKVHDYFLQNREIDVIRVNDEYTDWALSVAIALGADDFAVIHAIMALESLGHIVVVTDRPESDYVEYVEVKDA